MRRLRHIKMLQGDTLPRKKAHHDRYHPHPHRALEVRPSSCYQTWFLWPERLKNFRSIRGRIGAVVDEIQAGTFGNAYRGSSLETVVSLIAEQRQIFKGADHAFLWKPKLPIPDIYEHAENQRAFARLLHTLNCCDTEREVLNAIRRLSSLGIKGLGPAAANLLYFIHPTLGMPFNTAIVNGYNALMGSSVKLGKWDHYLAMREGVLALNQRYRDLLSNDLGTIAGLSLTSVCNAIRCPRSRRRQAMWLHGSRNWLRCASRPPRLPGKFNWAKPKPPIPRCRDSCAVSANRSASQSGLPRTTEAACTTGNPCARVVSKPCRRRCLWRAAMPFLSSTPSG